MSEDPKEKLKSIDQIRSDLRDQFFQAMKNAPSVDASEQRISDLLVPIEKQNFSLIPGEVMIENSHLFFIAFSVLRKMVPALKWDGYNDEEQLEHELDHYNRVTDYAERPSLVFIFGVDGKRYDSETDRLYYDVLSVRPRIMFNHQTDIDFETKKVVNVEIASAPRNYLSKGDEKQIGEWSK